MSIFWTINIDSSPQPNRESYHGQKQVDEGFFSILNC